jgi:hypothetical protein
LTEGNPRFVATGAILHRSRQDIFHFVLYNGVAVDVGLPRRWIDVEPNRHAEILRPGLGFPKYRRDWFEA